MNGILAAIDDMRAELGMSAGLLISAQRHRTEHDAFELLKQVQPWVNQILGFGLGGAEVGNPPGGFLRRMPPAWLSVSCRR